MAIGTGAAILGSAVLGTAGSAIASNSATKKAASASQYATDQATAVQNRALDLQQQNTAVARATGDAAMNELASRFGLGTPAANASAAAAANAPFNAAAYGAANPDLQAYYADQAANNRGWTGRFPTPESFYDWHYNQGGGANEVANLGRPLNSNPAPAPVQAPTPTPAETPATPEAPATANVDSQGAYTVARPEVAPAPVYEAPVYRETAIDPLDVSLSKYEKSPDYEFQLSEGNRNILANAAATGALESGAALKALQTFGQNLAMGDYGQWRDYTTNQYNQDRNYTANRDDAYNAFGTQQAMNKFNSANSTYQYGNTLAQNIHNSDRDYASNRYDTRTNNLLSLAGYGQNASNSYGNALQNNASNLSNAYFSNASNQGNAALAGAGVVNNALGNATNALAYYYGNKSPTTSATAAANYDGWSA